MNMTGKFSGSVTIIINICKGELYLVWCEAHQLEIVFHSTFEERVKDNFKNPINALTTYLRRLKNLILLNGFTVPN